VARPLADSVPHPTGLPLLDLDDPASVADFLRSDPQRYGYRAPEHR